MITSISGDTPNSDYGTWENFISQVCEVRGKCLGATFYGSVNCNYIVLRNQVLVQNFGYHGKALFERIKRVGWKKVYQESLDVQTEIQQLIQRLEKHCV